VTSESQIDGNGRERSPHHSTYKLRRRPGTLDTKRVREFLSEMVGVVADSLHALRFADRRDASDFDHLLRCVRHDSISVLGCVLIAQRR
jgi:hypothetical protein